MPKQERIPGTEPTTFPDVNKAAEDFLELRQAKKNAADAETRAKDALVRVMKKRELTVYRDPENDLVIQIDGKDVVKVTKPKKPRARRGRARAGM